MEIYWFYSILNYDYNLFPELQFGKENAVSYQNKTPALAPKGVNRG